MQKYIRFPKQDRLARGRSGFFETSGIALTTSFGDVVELNAWTGTGYLSESARLVVPVTHLPQFRDAIDELIADIAKYDRDTAALTARQVAAGCEATGYPCRDYSGRGVACKCADHGPFVLCRSDLGDGGWSLHTPGTTDDDIAAGDPGYLVSGNAQMQRNGEWSRPNEADYKAAEAAFAATSMEDSKHE